MVEVECLQGLNLLAHAQMSDLETGSECGGHGRCGKDRVWIAQADRQKLNEPTKIERHHLTDAEIQNGWRLACQSFPAQNGLTISVTLQ